MNKRILKKKAREFTVLCDLEMKLAQVAHKDPIPNRALMVKAILHHRINKYLCNYYYQWVKLRARHMILHGEVYGLLGGGKWLPHDFTVSYRKNSEQMFDLDTMACIGHSAEEIIAVANTMGW
jgi:hypothetical protein